MATSTKAAGGGSNEISVGTIAWSGTGNVTADDAAYATLELLAGETSNYLVSQGFGFAIPGDATINGVSAIIHRKATSGMPVSDFSVKLIIEGVPSGDSNASGDPWDTVEEAKDYGDATELWGLAITPATVNSVNFGIAIAAGFTADTANLEVDYIEITVHYTAATVPDLVASPTAEPDWSDEVEGDWFSAIVQASTSTPPVDAMDWLAFDGSFGVDHFDDQDADWFSVVASGASSSGIVAPEVFDRHICGCAGSLVLVSSGYGTLLRIAVDDAPSAYGTLLLVSSGRGSLLKVTDCIC